MVDRIVARKLGADLFVNVRLVCHQVSFFGDIGTDDGHDFVRAGIRNVEAANLSGVAIQQGKVSKDGVFSSSI